MALIAWGRFFDRHGNRITVPAPSTTPGAPWLFDFLAAEVGRLGKAGFSAIQLPPVSKAQGGAGDGCDGYGVFDRRDIGSKDQQGSRPTRYGDADSLRRIVANAHAAGLDVYLDLVLHQLMGENGGPGTFRYAGANGDPGTGRGAMHPGCFRGVPPANRPEDAVPVPADDFEFGCELVYQHCEPPGYTIEDALDYGDWLFRTTGADGGRFDDTKGTGSPFVSRFMHSRAMAGKFFYSEYFDGNPANLDWWANCPPTSSRSLVEDFTLHWALQAACNGGNSRALEGAGYAARNPFLACTFVDNPDTDTSPGQQVVSNKLLAYAFLLTIEGYPFVPMIWDAPPSACLAMRFRAANRISAFRVPALGSASSEPPETPPRFSSAPPTSTSGRHGPAKPWRQGASGVARTRRSAPTLKSGRVTICGAPALRLQSSGLRDDHSLAGRGPRTARSRKTVGIHCMWRADGRARCQALPMERYAAL